MEKGRDLGLSVMAKLIVESQDAILGGIDFIGENWVRFVKTRT